LEPGYVSLKLYYEGRALAVSTHYFEYRDLPFKVGMKRDREMVDAFRNQWDSEHSHDHKVRLVERVTYISQSAAAFNCANETSFQRDYLDNADARFDEETERQSLDQLVLNLVSGLDSQKLNILATPDAFNANLIHYAAALNLHATLEHLNELGVPLDDKISGTYQTPFIIASLCGHTEAVRVLNKQHSLNGSEDEDKTPHDAFVQMLNREFPMGRIKVGESSLGHSKAPGKQREVSPLSNLPRRCGISEQESKLLESQCRNKESPVNLEASEDVAL
jgi:hypothetical protein